MRARLSWLNWSHDTKLDLTALLSLFFLQGEIFFVEKKDKGYNRINKTESEMTKTLTVL